MWRKGGQVKDEAPVRRFATQVEISILPSYTETDTFATFSIANLVGPPNRITFFRAF